MNRTRLDRVIATTVFSLAIGALAACGAADAATSESGALSGADAGVPVVTMPGVQAAAVPTRKTDLTSQLEALKVPGLAAGIVKNGRLLCTASAGMADLDARRPVTADTLFTLASTSKTITATAVMQLFDDGLLQLDGDVNAYLPFQVHVPSCPSKPITARQLLTHTSSIADNTKLINCPLTCVYGSTLNPLVTRGADSPIALGDWVRGYLDPSGEHYDAKANFESGCPGTISDYSNMGVTLGASLVESIAKTSFEKFCKDRIFTPLGMKETSWKLLDIDPAHLAVPYDHNPKGYVAYGQFGEPDYPDGQLRSSVNELSRFLIMFMQFGEYDGKRILAKSTAEEMRKPQTSLDDTQGLVWFYDDFGPARPRVLGHDGSDNGTSTNMFFDPADGVGVILLSNGMWSDKNDDSPAADALMAQLFAEGAAK
jgi:CubicO group peptidase (beta-lactamase class C family)